VSPKTILPIEDNPSDVALTKRALEKARILNRLVAGDGQEALEYLFDTGVFAGRDPSGAPLLALMDLKLPKVFALDVLRRIRSDATMEQLTTYWLPLNEPPPNGVGTGQ
jgi:two-component system response regulator